MIPRLLEGQIQPFISPKKAIVLTGPRQVGKTTLVTRLANGLEQPVLWLTGDDPAIREALSGISLAQLKPLIGNYKVMVVDEAQRLTNAGLTLKLITDHFPEVHLLVTGSSSLDIAAQTKESLTGRKYDFTLLPLSFAEMQAYHGRLTEHALLEQRLIYGYYPEVVTGGVEGAVRLLTDLSEGLMYKDLLMLDQLKKPSLIVKILQALALQLGQEVQYHEVAQIVGADPATVERYIDLLEQSFVVFRLPSLSRNARNEIKKGRKIYFYDTGIRNAIIRNFNPMALRQDKGALWENFLIVERRKRNLYSGYGPNMYFWRTTSRQEIDYIEDYGGKLSAFEFKWNPETSAQIPKAFLAAYPGSDPAVVHRQNFFEFVGA
ncbi:MAG: ATP-binding protein [Bacteroidia bacterium]|nr:ATP-binding protein [Bacteroidia bacterium]